MAIQYMDNFQNYGTSEANLSAGTPWFNMSAGGSALVTDPQSGLNTRVFQVSNTVSTQPSFAVPTPTAVVRTAWRCWVGGFDSNNAGSVGWYWSAAGGNIQYILHLTPTGALRLVHVGGGDGDRIDSFSWPQVFVTGPVITSNAWQHIEMHLDFTTGAYELFVEGVSVASGTDAEGAVGGTCGLWQMRGNVFAGESTAANPQHVKDFVFADNTGSNNTGQIGTVQVITLLPNSDVSGDWTESTGTEAWSLLDETTPDDADYIQAVDDPLPTEQVLGLTNLPPDVVAIRAVQPMARTIKTDGGDANITLSLQSDGSEDTSGTFNPLTTASYSWFISELDPATAALWTPTAVDLVNLGIDRTL